MTRMLLAAILGGVTGCSALPPLTPEAIEVDGHTVLIKGWADGVTFGVDVKLESRDKTCSLYDLAVVTPSGRRLSASNWRDRSPKAPKVNVGFGMGIGGGGGGSHHGHSESGHSGGGPRVIPGVGAGVPLGGGDGRLTHVEARWRLADLAAGLTDCTLEVGIDRRILRKREITTVPLGMSVAASADTSPDPARSATRPDQPPAAGEAAKALIREIDFTAKGPPQKRELPA